MDLAQLELEQRLEIAHLLGLEQDEAAFYAQNPGLLNAALTNVFHNEQSYAAPADGQDVLDLDAASPRSEWADMARRAIARTPAADDSAILLQAIGATLYNRPFTVDAEISDEEITFLTGILADFDAGLTVSASVSQFNEAATAAAQALADQALADAQAAAAEWNGAQGEMQVLAQLATLGLIDPSEIAGGFQPEHAEILHDLIDSANTFRMMPPASAGAHAGVYVNALHESALGIGLAGYGASDMTLGVDGALQVLSHYTEGFDHSTLILDALTSGDPAQVQMAQGLIGVEITVDGSWTLESLNAAQAYLEAPQAGGVPDSLYSDLHGRLGLNHTTRALENGTMNMPSDADLDRIGASFDPPVEGLSSAPLSIQASTVTTWLTDPENHEAYATMVATQELTQDESNALDAARTVVEARIEEARIAAIVDEAQVEIIEETIIQNPVLAEAGSPLAEGAIGETGFGDAIYTDSILPIGDMAAHLLTQADENGMVDAETVVMELYYMGQNDQIDYGMMGGLSSDAGNLRTLTDTLVRHGIIPEQFDVTDAAQLENAISTFVVTNQWYTHGEAVHEFGSPAEALAQVSPEWSAEIRDVAQALTDTPEGPAAPAPEVIEQPEPAIAADPTFIGASLPVVGETDVANLGIDADVLEGIDPTELSLAALSYRVTDVAYRFDNDFDIEAVSLRDIMEFENMGASWSDVVYGSEYMVGDRTMLDTVLANGMSIEDAAARAGIDPDAPLNLEEFGDLAKMTEAIAYATHGETVGPFSADQLLNGSYLSLEGDIRPEDTQPDPEESLLSAHDCATCTGAFTVAALALPTDTIVPGQRAAPALTTAMPG